MEGRYHFIDIECVVNKQFFEGIKEMLSCIICSGIIVDPIQCKSCENAFCSICLQRWFNKSTTCPFKCSNLEKKEISRAIRNLLDKLMFICPNKCEATSEFNYENLLKHLNTSCERLKAICPSCNSFVPKSQIQETSAVKELKYEIIRLESEIAHMKIVNNELRNDIKNLNSEIGKSKNLAFELNSNAIINEEVNQGLIDKCQHFKGNYQPIFACCDKAYPCYVCHNEMENHTYQFSNKVMCLLCTNIYPGSRCTDCNVTQMYKKK